MGKLALAIRKEYILNPDMGTGKFIIGGQEPFIKLALHSGAAELLSRPECETNKDYVQFIPYITLVMEEEGVKKYFMYTRGDLSQEGRLQGKCSLGLGGHIEESPTHEISLAGVVYRAAKRELQEEVGLNLDELGYDISFMNYKNSPLVMLYNNDDEVGQYHIGVYGAVVIKPDDIKSLEEGVITKGQWLTAEEIEQKIKSNEVTLEAWSTMVFTSILYQPQFQEELQEDESESNEPGLTDVSLTTECRVIGAASMLKNTTGN